MRKAPLQDLAYTGVCKVWADKDDGEDRYFVNIFAPGMLEMMVNNREQLAAHPEIGKAFEAYTRLRLAPMAALFPEGLAMMRVIPVESAVSELPGTKPWERLSYYLNKYDTFSVSDCSCRQSRRVIGEGCGHLEKDICIQMGTGAQYYIRTGRGRQITREEATEILKFAEDNGLMHEMPATDGLGESAAICNCCGCACFSMRLATLFKTPDAIRSNFKAVADAEKCVACGQCVENCPTNALKLGQKLCAKNPVPKTEPHTARDHVWSEKNWNTDYRLNREDVADEGTAPCKTACPAHIAVQGYIKPVFEKEEKTGGMLALGIPSFRLEKNVLNAEIDVLREMGVEFKTGVEVGRDVTLDELRREGYEAFYLAIGAQGGRKLGVEGEDAEGVVSGIGFLRKVNLGHETKLSGKVVMIGGGNVAIDVARTAVRQGLARRGGFFLPQLRFSGVLGFVSGRIPFRNAPDSGGLRALGAAQVAQLQPDLRPARGGAGGFHGVTAAHIRRGGAFGRPAQARLVEPLGHYLGERNGAHSRTHQRNRFQRRQDAPAVRYRGHHRSQKRKRM